MKQGWEIKTIADVCTFIKNGANIKQERGAGGVPITRIETLSGGVFNRDRLGYANLETPDKYLSYVLEYGDLLFSHINSKTYIGRTVVYVPENDEQIIHGMNLLRLKLDFDLISPFFFQYYTRTDKFKAQVANRRKDAVNQSSITTTDIKTISLPVPPIAEQEKIVAELDCLSGIIEKKKQQLKELDNLALSIFYEMFGDPVENDKGWEKKRLDEIGKVITGNTPSTKDESNYSSADYCFVKPSDIAKDSISYISNTEFYISEKAYVNSRQLPKGSVLTTCIGIIGKVGILQKDATCNQQINAIIPNKDIDAKFLAHVLFMIRDILTDVANAPIVPIINKKEFSSVSIPIPSFSLQQEFASKIESIEKQKELIAKSIKETETLFNSRMDYYFN